MTGLLPWIFRITLAAALPAAVTATVAAEPRFPAPFAADVKVRTPGIAEPRDFAKYYVGETAVRYEYTKMPERQLHAAIIDLEQSMQWTLIPDQQTYFTFSLDEVSEADMVHFRPAPGSPCPAGTDSEAGGEEEVLGREAEKWRCRAEDGEVTTHWVDTRLRFPIKTENPDGSVVELHNIRVEDQPAEYFEVPERFLEAG